MTTFNPYQTLDAALTVRINTYLNWEWTGDARAATVNDIDQLYKALFTLAMSKKTLDGKFQSLQQLDARLECDANRMTTNSGS